jgi:hypothetical protein
MAPADIAIAPTLSALYNTKYLAFLRPGWIAAADNDNAVAETAISHEATHER